MKHTISRSRDFWIGLAKTDGSWRVPRSALLGDGGEALVGWIIILVGEGGRGASTNGGRGDKVFYRAIARVWRGSVVGGRGRSRCRWVLIEHVLFRSGVVVCHDPVLQESVLFGEPVDWTEVTGKGWWGRKHSMIGHWEGRRKRREYIDVPLWAG